MSCNSSLNFVRKPSLLLRIGKNSYERAQQAENKQEKIAAQNRQSVVNQLKNDLSDLRHQRFFAREVDQTLSLPLNKRTRSL